MTPTTLTARTPEDLLAAVPVVLGFQPTDSLVMLTFGGPRPFHARVDLPPGPDEVTEVVEMLLGPAREHGVRHVVLVAYSADGPAASRAVGALRREARSSGIDVLDAFRAHDGRWFSLAPGGRLGVPAGGVPYDVSAHPFAAQAVLDGRVTHGSRDELAASLAPDPERAAAVAAAVAALPRWGRDDGTEQVWVAGTVRRLVRDATLPDDVEAARLLTAVRVPDVRDVAREQVDRADVRAHVELWTDLLRRAPDALAAAPAALLAFAAWLAGHGALAWCALDRCEAVTPDGADPPDPAGLVAALLQRAVPPREWEEGWGHLRPRSGRHST
ncbi:DUF4192 domain-containing protein [Nocardioides sp. KIGAM211]|uniref:DUF4192 domain-containing protein n=1 Tax=Nocardioides luti TaxID=2761101 RepID=A0A7X0RFV3_9ACTN|nr:DUF4192 domain-containing protein [Nocardioides luti]MBB6626254.1 DUF4192 domain-containing protein [Nocardioides luti]